MSFSIRSSFLVACLCVFFSAPAAYAADTSASAKATQLLSLMGVNDSLTSTIASPEAIARSSAPLIQKIAEANPGKEEKAKSVVTKFVSDSFVKILPVFTKQATELYTAAFKPAELDDMIAFYKKPATQQALEAVKQAAKDPKVAPSVENIKEINAYFTTGTGKNYAQRLSEVGQKLALFLMSEAQKTRQAMVGGDLKNALEKEGLVLPPQPSN